MLQLAEKEQRVSAGELTVLRRYMMYYIDAGRMISHLHVSEADAWKDARSYIEKGSANTFHVVELKGKIVGRNEYVHHEVVY